MRPNPRLRAIPKKFGMFLTHLKLRACQSVTDPLFPLRKKPSKRGVTVWSYMVHLRHHGFPSPFLDWTRSPYVAAFFAFRRPIKDVKKVSICVYCKDPDGGHSSSQPEIRILKKHYFPTHRRHFLQQCEYTICVQNRESEWLFVPHEEAFTLGGGDLNYDVLWKFRLPTTERPKVLKLLDRSNINAFSLFQSEESLMETMAFRELDCHRLQFP